MLLKDLDAESSFVAVYNVVMGFLYRRLFHYIGFSFPMFNDHVIFGQGRC